MKLLGLSQRGYIPDRDRHTPDKGATRMGSIIVIPVLGQSYTPCCKWCSSENNISLPVKPSLVSAKQFPRELDDQWFLD